MSSRGRLPKKHSFIRWKKVARERETMGGVFTANEKLHNAIPVGIYRETHGRLLRSTHVDIKEKFFYLNLINFPKQKEEEERSFLLRCFFVKEEMKVFPIHSLSLSRSLSNA
jgi:hypothetical protein